MKRSIIRCVMIICFMLLLCFMVTSTQWRIEKHSLTDALPEQTAFFFPAGKKSEQYSFTTSFYWNHGNMPEVADVVINEIGRGENGVLYSAKINIDADFDERYSLGFDRFELGYFYVMRDKIYLIKNQEVTDTFQKDKKKYLQLQKEGIWIPFTEINSVDYYIKIKNHGEEFNDEWEKKLEYEGFNLAVKNGIWISGIGSFLKFNASEYEGEGRKSTDVYGAVEYFSNRERWYTTLDGKRKYSDFWYDILEGKYLLSIKGYVRKQIMDYPAVNYGFQFEFTKVDEFDGYKNPREEQYDFNVANMK